MYIVNVEVFIRRGLSDQTVRKIIEQAYDDVPDDVSQDEIKAWAITDTKKHLLSIDREYGENFTIGEVEFS